MAGKPTLGPTRPTPSAVIKAGLPPERQLWAFSFRYFRQMRYFGVGSKDATWFTSMLDRLAELSKKTIASTNANPTEKLAWRLHEIDWNSKGVPIKRDQLDWIDSVYLANEAEYPIQQFQITKALGRVIGFFDERRIFNVVLLDPMHNMQPSKYSDHKVRATSVSETVSATLIRFVESKLAGCKEANCVCRTEYVAFQTTLSNDDGGTTLLVHVSQELFGRIGNCISGGVADSIAGIIEASIDALEH